MKKMPFTIMCRSCNDGKHECDPSAGCRCTCQDGRELQAKIEIAQKELLLLGRREAILH